MSEVKYTPGPWWPVQDSGGRWYVSTRRDHEDADAKPTRFGATIAHGIGDHTEKRTSGNEEDNARLIAAAPELLEVLVALEKWFDTDHEILEAMPEAERADNARQLAKIRFAIAKAKGEA